MKVIKLTAVDIKQNNLINKVGDVLIFDFKNQPKTWNGFVNYINSKENALKKDGFFEFIEPAYNKETQKLSDYVFDEKNNTATKKVVDLTKEEIEVIRLSSVPLTVKNMDFRLVLIKAGITIKSVDTFIDAIEDETFKEQVLTLWNYAAFFERQDSLLIQMATNLGLTESKLDDLFIEAKE